MNPTVRDDPERSRYEILVDGEVLGFADYKRRPDHLIVFHAEVTPAASGAGLGTRLARGLLDDIRRQGRLVAPTCPFVAAVVRAEPDKYLDLVLPELRDRLLNGG